MTPERYYILRKIQETYKKMRALHARYLEELPRNAITARELLERMASTEVYLARLYVELKRYPRQK